MTETTAVAPRHTVGSERLDLPALALGSWHTFDRMDFSDSVDLVVGAVERGITLFDVGVYGRPGEPPVFTDVLFSAIVRASGLARERIQVSAKIWLGPYPEQPLGEQLDTALFRAGLDHAELGMLGDITDDDMDLDRLLDDMADLVASGRIGAWGVSNWPAGVLADAVARARERGLPQPQMVQLKYSLARRAIADGEPYRAVYEAGVGLQASDVLEGGILAGNPHPSRLIGRDPGSVRERIIESLPRQREIAESLDTTPARLAVAFAMSHPHNATTLFGATRLSQVDDALAAAALLDEVGAARLRELVDPLWTDRGIVDPAGA